GRATREDPALDDLHADLDLRLVARPSRPGRQDRRAVVAGEVLVGRVQPGFVSVVSVVFQQSPDVVVEFSPPITAKEDVMEVEVRSADESEVHCPGQGHRALSWAAATVPPVRRGYGGASAGAATVRCRARSSAPR